MWKIIYFELSLFSDSLFMSSHYIILDSSSLIKVCVSTLLSFNNKGPRIERCGTPIFKGKNLICNLQCPHIVSYFFLSNSQIVSGLNLPVYNIFSRLHGGCTAEARR